MNCISDIDNLTQLRLYKKLLDKGFQKTIYFNQETPNIWYKIEFTDENMIEYFIKELKEDKCYWEGSFDNMRLSIEIREDLSFSQYLFTEQKLNFGGYAFDKFTLEEFEQLLDKIKDKIV